MSENTRSARRAIPPIVAITSLFVRFAQMEAAGGILLLASTYVSVTHGSPVEKSWGIPMATDSSFASAWHLRSV